jgi:hypothetical protein
MHALLKFPLLLALVTTASAQTFDLGAVEAVLHHENGTAWAVGRDYKAALSRSGITFVPALGQGVPQNRELGLSLTRVHRGEVTLWDENAAPDGVLFAGERHVAIEHRDFVERYDARAEGVEQSFVFAQRPAGEGDLVVRCAVNTALQATVRDDGTLFLHDGAVGGVTIGTVTGIDALGRRCRGGLMLREGTLELRLPAAFVDAASYPMILDPLLAAGFLVGSATENEDQVDAAYGSATDTTLVVWRRSYSGTDQDILGQQVASNGTLSGPLLVLSSTGLSSSDRAPSVTYVHGRSRHVVCWLTGLGPVGPWTVRARPVNGSTPGSPISVSNGASLPNGRWIASSGDRSTFGTDALVVWARTFNTTSTGEDVTILHTSSLEVSLFGVLSASPPADLTSAIGSATGDLFALPKSRTPFGITALFLRRPDLQGLQNVYALDYDGAYLGESEHVATSDPAKQPFLAIDGDGTDFVAACRNYAGEMITRQITWTGTTFTAGVNTQVLGTAQSGACAVGFLGERFLVAWTEGTPNPFDSDVRGVTVKPDCETCSQTFTLATVARSNAIEPAIAAEFAGASTGQRALLAWDETDTTLPLTGSVVAHRFTAMVGTPPVTLTPGCGNGGLASAIGAFSPGNENFKFKLTGGDPTAPFALISLSLGGPSVLCGCELTQWIVLEAVFAVNGGADFPFVPWCDPSYLGTTIEFQWLLLGAAASPCPFVPNLAASNRVQVTLNP